MGKPRQKNKAAVALGTLGGLKAAGSGPRSRWAKMTADERSAAMREIRRKGIEKAKRRSR